MSKYADVQCNYYNDIEQKYCVDAWYTDDGDEEGEVIAKIDLATQEVEYLDPDAEHDEFAQEVINEMLHEGYALTE